MQIKKKTGGGTEEWICATNNIPYSVWQVGWIDSNI